MKKYDDIINDKEIIEIYSNISKFEDIDKGWAHHDLNHVINVANLVEKLLMKLGYDEEFIEEGKIAALLHDTGALNGKKDHALRSFKFAENYFCKKNLELKNEELVLEAIKIHSDGFNSDNIIALTLILADKLDIKYTRVAKEGHNVKGMKELNNIKDIEVNIVENILEINFICNAIINKKELEDFYFISKVFQGINAFSKKMDLRPEVLFNNCRWGKFYGL